MRGEIKRLHQEIATTMIYVTHDQIEAMTLADRIVLMRDGVIEQQGAPLDLFERPATLFVAGFLGSPQMNFVGGQAGAKRRRRRGRARRRRRDRWRCRRGRVPAAGDGADVILGSGRSMWAARPRARRADGHARIEAKIELVQPTGSRSYATFRLAGSR